MSDASVIKNADNKTLLVMSLALKDLSFSAPLSLCLIAAVAAIIAPLLMMVGLRTGIVESLRSRLLSDPHILEISIRGNWKLDQTWFDDISSRRDVAFVSPLTRSLSAQIDLIKSTTEFSRRSEIIPTGPGDPLLAHHGAREVTRIDEVVLSHSAGLKLNAAPGDIIDAAIARQVDLRTERARTKLRVIDIAPEAVTSKNAVFTRLEFLEQIERYFDLEPAPIFDGSDEFDRKAIFARARLYASKIEDVGALADYVREGGIDVVTRASEIEAVLAIERTSAFVFTVVAWVTGIGGAAAMIGFIIMNVDRRRRELAVLQLMGVKRAEVIVFPVTQAIIIGSIGLMCGLLLYYCGEGVFNGMLGDALQDEEFVSRLRLITIAMFGGAVTVVSALSAAIGGILAAQIEPAEALREI